MATTVLLEITPREQVDPDRFVGPPAEVAAVLRAAGQPPACGLSRTGDGPWRLQVQLSGRDRVQAGRELAAAFRRLGLEADTRVCP